MWPLTGQHTFTSAKAIEINVVVKWTILIFTRQPKNERTVFVRDVKAVLYKETRESKLFLGRKHKESLRQKFTARLRRKSTYFFSNQYFFKVVVVIYSNKVSFCGKLKLLFEAGRPAMFVFARSRWWSKFFSRCTESISRDLLVEMTYFFFLQILWSFQKRFVTF